MSAPRPPRRALLALARTLGLAFALIGCSVDIEDRGQIQPNPRLITLFDLQRALAEGGWFVSLREHPIGFAASELLTPTPDGGATLNVLPAFSEGDAAAFVVPEVFVDYAEIWAQPWYFLVTEWDARSPMSKRLMRMNEMGMMVGTPPIFDPHYKSRFYSPFWQLFYAVVPQDTPPFHYRSSEQLFNDGVRIYKAGLFTYSVRPENVKLPTEMVTEMAMGMERRVQRVFHPIIKRPVGNIAVPPTEAYVDGEPVAYFQEGGNNFVVDENLVVEEVPLFMFVRYNASSQLERVPGAFPVMGSGPLFARRVPEVAPTGPRFGALSRLHLVIVPAAAAPFTMAGNEAAVAKLQELKLDPAAYEGRMASNGGGATSCFKPPMDPMAPFNFPMSCTWLDAQVKIENAVGRAGLRSTEINFASPLVFYGGRNTGAPL
jgi:hypothetical protein